ncbi:MAG: amidohydrolase family protein [Planctomycetota bacterium]|nr:amidohydrolase family protein [Planctomycetota bacterium]
MPAVNAHTHLYSGLAPLGMPAPEHPPETFLQILQRVWWRLDRALDEDSLAASARFYVASALLHGTTGLIDHHESPEFIEGSLDVIADAGQDLGMPAVLCYGATERNGGKDEARRGLAECRRFIESNHRSLVRGVIGLHASFTVGDATMEAAGEMARDLGTVVHVHLAEDLADLHHANGLGHDHPLQRLLASNALPEGSILAHGVHMREEEIAVCNDAGLWLVNNPRSNEGNGVGWPGLLGLAQRVALGTDGWESCMADEVAAGRRLEIERDEIHDVAGSNVFAQRLERGADLLAERFGTEGAPKSDSSAGKLVIAGRTLVEDGRLVSGDMDAIAAQAETQAAGLWQRMAAIP